MAYTPDTLYQMVAPVAGGLISSSSSITPGGGSLWIYRTTDASSVWDATSYCTDAYAKGMRKYDMVLVINTGSTIFSLNMVTATTTGSTSYGMATWGTMQTTA